MRTDGTDSSAIDPIRSMSVFNVINVGYFWIFLRISSFVLTILFLIHHVSFFMMKIRSYSNFRFFSVLSFQICYKGYLALKILSRDIAVCLCTRLIAESL